MVDSVIVDYRGCRCLSRPGWLHHDIIISWTPPCETGVKYLSIALICRVFDMRRLVLCHKIDDVYFNFICFVIIIPWCWVFEAAVFNYSLSWWTVVDSIHNAQGRTQEKMLSGVFENKLLKSRTFFFQILLFPSR